MRFFFNFKVKKQFFVIGDTVKMLDNFNKNEKGYKTIYFGT